MPRTAALAGVFCLSGACAVIFETLWFHQASLSLGNSALAASLVLSAFMAGMALGNWSAARMSRIRDGIRAYALLEVAIACFGLGLVWSTPQLAGTFAKLAQLVGARPAPMGALRFMAAFALLLPPSAAMGMSLPLLVRAVARWDRSFGRSLGLLYGANTLGAAIGGVAAELWLVARLRILGTALCTALFNLVAAALALSISRAQADTAPAADGGKLERVRRRPVATLCAIGFGAGLLLLGLEVVWLRVLTLLLNDTPLAFAMVLALVLSGIAAGSLLASWCMSRWPHADDCAWLAAYAAGALGMLGYLAYPKLMNGSFPAYQPAATIAAIAAPLVVPTSLASGALFTLHGARLRRFTRSESEAAGWLAFANTLGAGVGPLLATFLLVPQLGMERALLGLLGAYGVLAFALVERRSLRYASALVLVAALASFPHGRIQRWNIRNSARRWTQSDARLVAVRQGVMSTLLHVVHELNGAPLFDQIATNAYSMTTNSFFGRRYMKASVYLPAALHPKLRRALVVGFGIGNTAKALTDMPELEHLDIVDVSRDMLDESRHLRVMHGSSPLDDARVRVTIEDGRFFLQSTPQRYDLITGEPPPPIIAGVVNLYTREYFELVRSRLAPGGYATYWLPVMNISAAATKALIRGFCEAFADCSLWHGAATNLLLMGSRDARGPANEQRFNRAWNTPVEARELSALGFEMPAQLSALFIGDAAYLDELTRDAPPLTDDRPKRLQAFVDKREFAPLQAVLSDARAAHERFQRSAWIARVWPERYRHNVESLFEVQALLDALLSGEPTPLRTTKTLHQMLMRTRLRLPVLLLMNSGPDAQAALARLPAEQRARPVWLLPRAAGLLADRDVAGALELHSHVQDDEMPIPEVREYLDFVVRRERARATP
jgi:predicted membrane-bound spermidine synthase